LKPVNEIAVVVPCYNLGRTIDEAIDSVLGQTRPAAEVMIVDDGSTDILTKHALARINHPRIHVTTIEHSGVAAARNYGVGLSRAPYIVLLDADDVLALDYLEKTAARLDMDEGLSFVSCSVQAFEGANYIWKPPPCTALEALTHGTVHISSMFRRDLWNMVGGFDLDLPAYEDLDFWLRAICLGLRGEILEEPLLFYRARKDSRYHRGIQPEIYQAVMKAIIEKHKDVLHSQGTKALYAKESFLQQVHEYQRLLIQQRDMLKNDATALQREIETLQITLAQKENGNFKKAQLASREPQLATCWEQSVPGRYFDKFLMDRRWLVRGQIAIICDSPTALAGIESIRWDARIGSKREERFTFSDMDRLMMKSYDCIMLLAFVFPDNFKGMLEQTLKALNPGGSLLLAIPGLSYPRIMDTSDEQPFAEQNLCEMLGGVLPLDQFELIALGNLTTLTAALHNRSATSLNDSDFNSNDSRYPVLMAASAVKPEGGKHPRIHWPKRAWPTPTPKGAVILAYHRIASLKPDTHQLCMPADCFYEQMRYLKERCTVLTLEEVFWAIRDGGLPPRAVSITIDDGYLDAMTTAAEILKEYRIPGTFFVNTDRLDEKHEMWHDVIERILVSQTTLPPMLELTFSGRFYRLEVKTADQRLLALYELHGQFMSMPAADREKALAQLSHWAGVRFDPRDSHRVLLAEEVRALSQMAGCAIGSHSAHHLSLADQPVEVQRAELHQAKETLEALIDKPVISFSYPFGAYSQGLAEEVRMTPHLFGVTVQPELVTSTTDPMLLPRYEIKAWSGLEFSVFIERTFQSLARTDETN
jgi:peptidoglycan/xylan/chitin deacetylase (PgdA/CDA1 family)/glycosyltransferase involved in cell wall biosynthesis